MSCASRRGRSLLLILFQFFLIFAAFPKTSGAADLTDETARGYASYLQATEARMAREQKLPDRFLHIESLSQSTQSPIWTALKRGEVWVEPLDATDESGRVITAPHGTITHWVGDVFMPQADIRQVLAVLQDYDHFHEIYKPEMERSRLLERSGETFHAYFRVHRDTPWVNPTFNIEATVTFTLPDADHAASRMTATRIAQVENAGKPNEQEESVGHDGGYLWRLDTFWRLEARDGGVVGEWEALTLSRDIPFLLRWLVRPFVERLARQTLRDELLATRREVERRRAAGSEP